MSQAHLDQRTVTSPLYERDLYAWVQEQVALLRAGRLGEIDAENIAEEISDVGAMNTTSWRAHSGCFSRTC
jgi:hypothetical protein